MRILLLSIALLLSTVSTASDTADVAVSAAFSTTIYTVCKNTLEDKYGCTVMGLVLTNIVMFAAVHTNDSRDEINGKLTRHAIGASVVIPMALVD